MNAIIDAAIHHRKLVLSLLVAIFLGGMFAYINIVKERSPDVSMPFFFVSITHEGISPEDSERLLIKPMESHLRNIIGLKELTAMGFEGGAQVFLEFQPDVDINWAKQQVREAVDMGKSRLPQETREPVIREAGGPNQRPVLVAAIHGQVPETAMIQLVKQLRDLLESNKDILEVQISGERQQQLEVIVDPARLVAYNISPRELLTIVNNNNRLVPAGSITTQSGRFSVKVPGLVEGPSDVLNLPIKISDDGVITLRDVTDVRRTFKEKQSMSRYNGQPAMIISIVKRTGSNVVETVNNARTIIDGQSKSWPSEMKVSYIMDMSDYVVQFLESLRNNVLSAITLVAIIVVGALGLRSASLVGIAIPGSFLFGILWLYLAGDSINNVVMFGLILSIGLLVDGAIVVAEYADRKMVEGHNKMEAYRLAAQRMAWPITSSTLTTIAAFFPLIFWPGIMGKFMSHVPITLIYVLTGSLFMALIFLPTMGATFGMGGKANPDEMKALAADSEFDVNNLKGVTGWYAHLLQSSLRAPGWVLLIILLIMGLIINGFYHKNTGQRLFSKSEPQTVSLVMHARGNLGIEESDKLLQQLEQRIVGLEDDVKSTWTTTRIGSASFRRAEDVIGNVTVYLKDDLDRDRSYDEIEVDLRKRVKDIPGAIVEVAAQRQGPVRGKNITLNVSSENIELIDGVVDLLKAHMLEHDAVLEMEDSRTVPGIEWALDVDRAEAGRYGTDISTIGGFIHLLTNGTLAGRYRPNDSIDEEDIRIRFPKENSGIKNLDDLIIQTSKGGVPITNFVQRVPKQKVGQIRRSNGSRVAILQANTAVGDETIRVVAHLKQWLKTQNIPPMVRVQFTGNDEAQQQSTNFMKGAFITSLVLMGIILLAQFNSFYHVALILSSIILSTVGVLFGMIVTGREFVIVMTGLGIIALAGIVVNNNIVLIDTYVRLVKQGIEPIEAIIHTGAQRLRPVLLTTATTIIGLLPMAFNIDINFFSATVGPASMAGGNWIDLATAVIFGLSFATVLTLIFTPCALALRVKHKVGVNRALKLMVTLLVTGTVVGAIFSLPEALTVTLLVFLGHIAWWFTHRNANSINEGDQNADDPLAITIKKAAE